MKYFLLSDIHGSLSRLKRVLDIYYQEHCDMLLLLGDILNYGPRNGLPEGLDARGVADALNPLADEIVAVRGNCDSEVDQMLLHFPIMNTFAILVDEGRKIFLTHGHVYNKENMPPGHFDAIIYGHTHLWELEKNNEERTGSSENIDDAKITKGTEITKGIEITEKGNHKVQSSNFKVQSNKVQSNKLQSKVVCNTGSITFPKGGRVPTFGMMDNGVISIRDLENHILAECEI